MIAPLPHLTITIQDSPANKGFRLTPSTKLNHESLFHEADSNQDPFDLIEGNLIIPAVIEACSAG